MFRSLLVAFAICFSGSVLADVVIMSNGDKLTGRLDSVHRELATKRELVPILDSNPQKHHMYKASQNTNHFATLLELDESLVARVYPKP